MEITGIGIFMNLVNWQNNLVSLNFFGQAIVGTNIKKHKTEKKNSLF